MSTDYSRFYLCGSTLTGHQLCCLDCDEDDRLPWLTEDPTLDLGEMVRMADEHVAQRHPAGQPEPEPEQPSGVEWLTVPFRFPGTHTIARGPEFSGVFSYLEGPT
jgi:hypothetical protein